MSETRDGFLGETVQAFQPKSGFRAGTDTVLLAAAVMAQSGDRVLELGAGSGVGLLCLGKRVANLELCGVERIAENADRANRNMSRAGLSGEVIVGDIFASHHEWLKTCFPHVFANPPFFASSDHTAPDELSKAGAHILERPVADWVRLGIKRTAPKGFFTLIFPSEGLQDILKAIPDENAIKIRPVYTKSDERARRILVQIQTQSRAGLKMLAPLILRNENGAPTTISEAITREASAIEWL